MNWTVALTGRAAKQLKSLPSFVREAFVALAREIEIGGPVRGNWKNYSKLGGNEHHCHLKSGRPTYVVCWRADKEQKTVEVYYVGTHEKAPY